MSENVLEPGPMDDDHICVLVDAELACWTRRCGVARAPLAAAIEQAGPAIAHLRRVRGEPVS